MSVKNNLYINMGEKNMENKIFEYKGYYVMLKYNGTPNISIFSDNNFGRFPDTWWFAESYDLEKEAKEEIDKHIKK